jgi:hypothetical protein
MDNMSSSSESDNDSDNLGKLPLAIMQLSLAAERASKAGNTALFKTLNDKINNLLGEIE